MPFTELLQISLGNKFEFSRVPSADEWRELFLFAKKQALLGITCAAIERVPQNQRPPRQLILQWIAEAEHIKQRNKELNARCMGISQMFFQDGFSNIILKGQSVAIYYKNSGLDLYRTSGDVDIWLDGSRKDIIAYVRKRMLCSKVVYHHMDFPEMDGVEVEVHFTPSWMNSYFTNRKLQNYFNQNKKELFVGINNGQDKIPTPSLAFDRVFILVHIYRHLFHEGVGLRQLMDYYFVLCQGFTKEEQEKTVAVLRSLKMERFASAVMWVLQDVFGMEKQFLLVEPNEKEGKFLLEEIVRSGNFGQYDLSMVRSQKDSNLLYGLRKVKRNFRFIRSYPSEVLWSPFFKLWHFFWRKRYNN